ncbi:MAG: hypothetical protein IPK13_17105 [Deltaproteobacteria bacterium]|nr:hypothetical protein [Deltaproteobacteria bacterium]
MRRRVLIALIGVAISGTVCGIAGDFFPLFFNDSIVNTQRIDESGEDEPSLLETPSDLPRRMEPRRSSETRRSSDVDDIEHAPGPACRPHFLFLEDVDPLIADFDEAMRSIDRPASKAKLRGYAQQGDAFVSTIELSDFSDAWSDMSGTYDETFQVITLVVPERIVAFDRSGHVLRSISLAGERYNSEIARLADGRYLVNQRVREGTRWSPRFALLPARWWESPSESTPPFVELPSDREDVLRFGVRFARRYGPVVQPRIAVGWTERGSDNTDHPRVAFIDTEANPGQQTLTSTDLQLPAPTQGGLMHSLHEVPGGGLIVVWSQWSSAEASSHLHDYHASYWDGRSWHALSADLSAGRASSFALAVTPAGEVLAAVVHVPPQEEAGAVRSIRGTASRAAGKKAPPHYRLSLQSWDPWGKKWQIVTSENGGGLSETETSFKNSPRLWLDGETLHLGWLEETQEDAYSTSDLFFSEAHGKRPRRSDTTHPRDFFAVRYGLGQWVDLQTSRTRRQGLLGGELMMRYDFIVVDCL